MQRAQDMWNGDDYETNKSPSNANKSNYPPVTRNGDGTFLTTVIGDENKLSTGGKNNARYEHCRKIQF